MQHLELLLAGPEHDMVGALARATRPIMMNKASAQFRMQQMTWANHLVPSPIPEVAAALHHTAFLGFSVPQTLNIPKHRHLA